MTALSVRVSGSGGGCAPVCPELVLDPVFDPYVFDYSVTVPARVPEVTVDYTTAGGIARVTPQDAAPPPFGGYNPVPGYQLELSTDSDFSAIAAGNFHSCGIKTDASVVCWGDNSSGQADTPAGRFSAIAAGYFHSCGIKTDDSAVCWGSNGSGRADAPAGPFTAIAAGSYHSCGIKTDASAVCWGSNSSGQADAPAGPFTAIAAGGSHSCGIKTDDSAVCWGSNGSGRADAPAGSFSEIAAGGSHSCGDQDRCRRRVLGLQLRWAG